MCYALINVLCVNKLLLKGELALWWHLDVVAQKQIWVILKKKFLMKNKNIWQSFFHGNTAILELANLKE